MNKKRKLLLAVLILVIIIVLALSKPKSENEIQAAIDAEVDAEIEREIERAKDEAASKTYFDSTIAAQNNYLNDNMNSNAPEVTVVAVAQIDKNCTVVEKPLISAGFEATLDGVKHIIIPVCELKDFPLKNLQIIGDYSYQYSPGVTTGFYKKYKTRLALLPVTVSSGSINAELSSDINSIVQSATSSDLIVYFKSFNRENKVLNNFVQSDVFTTIPKGHILYFIVEKPSPDVNILLKKISVTSIYDY
jgi:hypothetical protein